MAELTSRQNPQVKYVVKLREDRRQRQRDGFTIVEGQYELELALTSGLYPREVFFCEEFAGKKNEAFNTLKAIPVTPAVFKKMSQRENPDGWLAIMPVPSSALNSMRLPELPLIVLVESIEKPGNLGAILRTSDAAGVDGLLLCDPRVELYNPNVVRASRGTLFTVPAFETTKEEALAWLREKEIKILAAMPNGETVYSAVDYQQPICILMGTEDTGLTDFWIENSDLRVNIPMAGKVNSLNVSTSTAIILYEAVRQRRQEPHE